MDKVCFSEGYGGKSKTVASLSDCCDAAKAASSHSWTYYNSNKTCTLYEFAFHTTACDGVSASAKGHGPGHHSCECPRVHQAVGRQNLSAFSGGGGGGGGHGPSHMFPAGGLWYSHPAIGECKGGHYVGDGSGCTWRAVQRLRAISASCMYAHIDKTVEDANAPCFQACPQPGNVTSTCFLKCYSAAVGKLSHDALTVPWEKSFASKDKSQGGCPEIEID